MRSFITSNVNDGRLQTKLDKAPRHTRCRSRFLTEDSMTRKKDVTSLGLMDTLQ